MSEPRRIDRPSFTIRELIEVLGWEGGEAAHELNNLLTAIYGYAELGILDSNASDDSRKYFDQILKIAERSSDLVHDLLTHSRSNSQSESVNLNTVIEDMDQILRYIVGEDIEFITNTFPDLGKTTVNPAQIRQVLLNLSLNARDAMPNGGRLIIQTANVTVDESSIEHPVELEAGEYVMMVVADNGSGISESTREHIFKPFFTTKGEGSGTGLGLSTCNRIVAESGGQITFESRWGTGTSFKIYLPRLD